MIGLAVHAMSLRESIRRGIEDMSGSARYVKLVEWSEEDQAFVGRCPDVVGPCCHGDDEVEVYRELCGIVEEWLELARWDGRPLPPATFGSFATLGVF